jgi:mevalonate kinase
LDGKGCVLLDSGIVGKALWSLYSWKIKKKGFRMLKNQFVKYTDACVEKFLGGI